MWSVSNQLLRSTNRECPPQTNSSQSDFTGRIDRRLSLVYISLFVLLLIVGGASLYLLGSHLIKSAAISRQSEQIHIVEQIDRHLQTFTSAIQLAHLQGNTITNHYLENSSRQFETLLTLYRNSGGSERNILEMRQMISDAESVTAAIANRMRNNNDPTPPVNTHDLTVMESIQQRSDAMWKQFGVPRPIGIIVYSFRDSIQSFVSSGDTYDLLAPTTPATLLEVAGTFLSTNGVGGAAVAGPMTILTVVGELFPLGGIPYTHLSM